MDGKAREKPEEELAMAETVPRIRCTDYTEANTPLFSGYQRLCIHNAGGCITQGNHPDTRGPEAEEHLVTEVQSRKTSS